jgi:hypothetical protein
LFFLSLIIFLIVIGIVNPLHKCFPVVYFRGKRIIQKSFKNITICWTEHYCVHLISLAYFTPIQALFETFF